MMRARTAIPALLAALLLAGAAIAEKPEAPAGAKTPDQSAAPTEPAKECSTCTLRHKALKRLQDARAPRGDE